MIGYGTALVRDGSGTVRYNNCKINWPIMKWKILKHFKCNFSCDLEKKIELSLCDAKNVAEIKVENLEIYADMNMNSSRMNT